MSCCLRDTDRQCDYTSWIKHDQHILCPEHRVLQMEVYLAIRRKLKLKHMVVVDI